METAGIKPNKGFIETIMPIGLKVFDMLMNRFLYVTIAIVVFLSTMQIWTNGEIGFIVYLTAGKDIIGDRPSRLFGLMSYASFSIMQARILIFFICLAATLILSTALFLFAKDIKDDRHKIFVIFGASAALELILDYYRYMMWEYASVALYIAVALIAWAFWFLLKTDKKFVAPLFAAAAQFMDSRAFVYILIVSLMIVFIKRIHKENKKLKIWNMLTLSSAALILAFTFVNVDFENKIDEDSIDSIFTARFVENGVEEEDVNKAMYAFKFNAYLRVSPQELLGDSFTNVLLLKDIPFEDHNQLIMLLFFGALIVYDHKDDFADKKEVTV